MTSLEDIDEEFLSDEEALDLEPTLKNLIDQKSLQWIFVGGKGGVGKTTISSCLAIQLAKHRESVLIISTDPAHNLSDAFNQKFSDEPTKVNGFENLFAMEIDPTIESEDFLSDFMPESSATGGLKNMIKEVGSSLPGMDEISSFMEIMKQVKSMKFSVVVFDTAPTGHTLRLLSFPSMLEKGVGKMMNMQNMGGLISQVTQMLGGSGEEDMQEKISQSKNLIEVISNQFKDPNKTTFVCVCIPEFLSVYETERLVQELTKSGIDTHNIVVNQLVFQPENCECKICQSRMKIQKKYLNQVFELYDAFHVVQMPLLGEEVRGPKALLNFGENLMTPYPMAHKKEDLAKLNPTTTTTTSTKQ